MINRVNIFRIKLIYGSAIRLAMGFSVAIHLALLAITFTVPQTTIEQLPQLKVVLVNNKSNDPPAEVEKLAQVTLNGGGNIEDNLTASANLPDLYHENSENMNFSRQRIKSLEAQAHQLIKTLEEMTKSENHNQVLPEDSRTSEFNISENSGSKVAIKKLKSEISKEWIEYQKMPKREFIGSQTKKVIYAEYVDNWREKIEQVGTSNYPRRAKEGGVYGDLLVTVSIRSDGSLEKVTLEKTSGFRVLDEAVKHIVELSGPFPPFPAEMREATDVLSITRNWSFTRSDLIVSGDL